MININIRKNINEPNVLTYRVKFLDKINKDKKIYCNNKNYYEIYNAKNYDMINIEINEYEYVKYQCVQYCNKYYILFDNVNEEDNMYIECDERILKVEIVYHFYENLHFVNCIDCMCFDVPKWNIDTIKKFDKIKN